MDLDLGAVNEQRIEHLSGQIATYGAVVPIVFGRNWAGRSPLPVIFQDERLSTSAVTRTLLEADASRRRRADVVDKMAAAYILQGALDRLRNLR